MAEWLTHLTMVVEVSCSSPSGVPFRFHFKIVFDCFFSSTAVKRLTTRKKTNDKSTGSVFSVVDNQLIRTYSRSSKIEVQKSKDELKNDAII